MEAAPPTYEKATLVDYLDLIALYIPSSDLCKAALVCSKWHATFAPHIWGNPASHFGIENDRVYVALTRFKRTLQIARLLVRSMTHTLHLPPAHAEIYNGPRSDWLRESLSRLPNLQSLIVRGLPFFDHAALLALQAVKPQENVRPPEGVVELPGSNAFSFQPPSSNPSVFELRLLDASRCSNLTSRGLAQSLCRFEKLIYLDLSFTYPARDPTVMATLYRFSGLQVLKLRGISLTDDGLEVLAQAIELRVRSLDIRDNNLTDRSVRTLLDNCFTRNRNAGNGNHSATGSDGTRSPSLLPYLGSEMLEIYQGEDFEGYLRTQFTGSFVNRLAIEDAPVGGITHLYVAGNALTAEGASGLLRSGRLHVFDLDTIKTERVRHPSLSDKLDAMPGVEKLAPVFWKCAASSLTFLRIDHSIVTKDSPAAHSDEVIQGRVELDDTSLPIKPAAVELDTIPTEVERHELPGAQTPRAELPGDPMQFLVSPAVDDTYRINWSEEVNRANNVRRGSAFAPEVVDQLGVDPSSSDALSPVSDADYGTMTLDGLTLSGIVSPMDAPSTLLPPQPPASRARSYSSLGTERKARINAHTSNNNNLHPVMLPHVSSLVLTDVPPFSPDKELSDRLIGFIRQCAEENWLAKKQANLDYSAPPGRKGHASAIRHSTNKIFALKRVVLELATEKSSRRKGISSPWQHTTGRSLTEDRDSESLWDAAETDFSFFGEGEECELPSLERGRFAHSFGSNEKEVHLGSTATGYDRKQTDEKSAFEPRFDTVALLSAFRKDRKLAHERSLAAGAENPETDGYWEGLVQVVRPGVGLRSDEEVDYYGNRFTGGYLYR